MDQELLKKISEKIESYEPHMIELQKQLTAIPADRHPGARADERR